MSDLWSLSDSVAVGGGENVCNTSQCVPPGFGLRSLYVCTPRLAEDYCILDNGANQLTSAAPVFRSGVSNSSLMTEGA